MKTLSGRADQDAAVELPGRFGGKPARRTAFDHASAKNTSAAAANAASAPHSATGDLMCWKNCAPNHGPTE